MFYKQSPQTRTRNESRGGIKPMFQRHCSQTRTLGREKRGEAESNQCFIDSAHKPEIWKRTEAESNQCSIETRTLEEKGYPKWNQTNVLQTVSTNQNFGRERRPEVESNQCSSAYRPNYPPPLGQAGPCEHEGQDLALLSGKKRSSAILYLSSSG